MLTSTETARPRTPSTMSLAVALALIILVIALPAAAADAAPPMIGSANPAAAAADAAPPMIGSANPAAVYCEALGYEYIIGRDDSGERGLCVLPDGRRVDAWDFYRGKVATEFSWGELNGYRVESRLVDHGSFTTEEAVCLDARGETVGTLAEMMGLTPTEHSGFTPPPARELPDRWGVETEPFIGSRDLPTSYDWRDVDGVTSVKDQASCGSCWAFGSVAPLECNIKIKDGVEVDLSEQWLVSCNQEGYGCGGGWWVHDYHLTATDPCGDTGAVLETYFPYSATDAPCNCPYPHDYFIEGWAYVPGGDVPPPEAIKQAILDYGPVSVAVAVDQNFSDYTGGVFNLDTATEINHGVALVGWDDSQGTSGVWLLRNSWGSDWGEDGYMRIEYGVDLVGYGATYIEYRDPLLVSLPDGPPQIVPPDESTTFTVQIEEIADTYVADSGLLHYRYDGGAWLTSPLVPIGGDLFEATLPPAACTDAPEFYVSAEGLNIGEITEPRQAPGVVYSAFVGEFTAIFVDDFESDLGWTVTDSPGLTDGTWGRGVPVGGGDRGDPPTDGDGSGSCYLTDNVAGNSDVDGGTTYLISPAIDVSSADDAVVSFLLWYTNDFGDEPNNDTFEVYVSDNNGATWTLASVVGPSTPVPYGWYTRSVSVGDHVGLTSQLKVRLAASDLGGGSVVEAGVDAFTVNMLTCEATGVDEGASGPRAYALHANVPNPFNPHTLIRYELPAPSSVTLRIFDASGRVVRTLASSETRGAGAHTVWWDGANDRGEAVASGAYFYRLEAGGETLSRKMMLLK